MSLGHFYNFGSVLLIYVTCSLSYFHEVVDAFYIISTLLTFTAYVLANMLIITYFPFVDLLCDLFEDTCDQQNFRKYYRMIH